MEATRDTAGDGPAVSVVMTFWNTEKFIEEAIESILAQTYSRWELLLVDDGSSDCSSSIARRYAEKHAGRISFLEHEGRQNRGISASRNLGIRHARGKYVAFLDSDDVWLPDKLSEQLAVLESHPQAAMIYGLTQYWYGWTGNAEDRKRDFVPDLGIPTGVLYDPPSLLTQLYPLARATAPSMSDVVVLRETVEAIGGFEEEFRGMYEDQAFLVKVYLNGSVFVANEHWDKYRIHPNSCLSVATEAGQYEAARLAFLNWFESYLDKHAINDEKVRNALHKACLARIPNEDVYYDGWQFRVVGTNQARIETSPGRPGAVRIVIDRCETDVSHDIQLNRPRLKIQAGRRYKLMFRARADRARDLSVGVALAHDPWTNLGLYESIRLTPGWQDFEREFTAAVNEDNARIHFDVGNSDVSVDFNSVSLRLPDGAEAPGGIQFGTLRRVTPVSRMWGYDRGLPIDRYYIEQFLRRHSGEIRGRVMEIEDNSYTRRFGGDRVSQSDILHVVEGNPRATIVGDLTCAPHIPSDTFDCIILTQTLQLIYDLRAAMHTLHRILRPGGVVLATFPGISQTNDRDWANDWYWSFTPLSGRRLFEEAFPADCVQVEAVGNVLSATSFLHGLAAEELTREELEYSEPGYVVTIGVVARKSGGQS